MKCINKFQNHKMGSLVTPYNRWGMCYVSACYLICAWISFMFVLVCVIFVFVCFICVSKILDPGSRILWFGDYSCFSSCLFDLYVGLFVFIRCSFVCLCLFGAYLGLFVFIWCLSVLISAYPIWNETIVFREQLP